MAVDVTSNTVIYAISYLLLFRLAIIALGALSIYLGYRLFLSAFEQKRRKAETNADIVGKAGEIELSIKNAAPGTAFAGFGALITILVLATNPAEFTLKENSPQRTESTGQAPAPRAMETRVRAGEDTGDVLDTNKPMEKEDRQQRQGNPQAAEQAHTKATLFIDKALDQAKLAAEAAPNHAAYRDTLAGLYFIVGQRENAIGEQTEAVALAPDNETYAARLAVYKTN